MPWFRKPWPSSLLAGALLLLLLGFTSSALANRLELVAWGLASTAVYAGVLRHGWRGRWRGAGALGVLAIALCVFAVLMARHQEVLDLGFRALLPALYHPILTRPATVLVAAAPPAIAAAVAAWASRTRPA